MSVKESVSKMIEADKLREKNNDHQWCVSRILTCFESSQRIIQRSVATRWNPFFRSYYHCYVCSTQLKEEYTDIWESFYDKEYRGGYAVCDPCLEKILKGKTE